MKTIDNLGFGNCMYYAYSISLMYYLRSEKDQTRVSAILRQFPIQQRALEELINRNKNIAQSFSRADTIKIQQLLGPACRALASESVKKEFLANPEASQITSNAMWKITKKLKKYINLELFKGEIVGTTSEALSEAELFKVKHLSKAIAVYAKKIAKNIEREFYQLWSELSPEEQHDTNRTILREAIIQRKTIEFFTNDNNNYLNHYINYLNTDTTWGSAETLATFHHTLTNNILGGPIHLCIQENGQYTDRSDQTRELSIIINNYHNTHWVSVIPEKFLLDEHQISQKQYNETNALLDKALDKIADEDIKQTYKSELSTMVKQITTFGLVSNIANIDTATAYINEGDEQFAKRLQMAEIEVLLKRG